MTILQNTNTVERILDFAERDSLDPIDLLHKLADAVTTRQRTVYQLVVEIGMILQYIFAELPDHYPHFVEDLCDMDMRSATNYRNLAKNFADLPSDLADRTHLKAAYSLAWDSVDGDLREWFVNTLENNPEMEGNTQLAFVTRRAPAEIRDRFDRRELTLQQTYDLTHALQSAAELVQSLSIQEQVSNGATVEFLDRAWNDYMRRSPEHRDSTIWKDITHNDLQLYFVTADNREHCVRLQDVTPDTITLYMEYRSAEQRATHDTAFRFRAKLSKDSGTEIQLTNLAGWLWGAVPEGTIVEVRFQITKDT